VHPDYILIQLGANAGPGKGPLLEDVWFTMPFHSSGGYEFSEAVNHGVAPFASGVCALYSGKEWMYIDEAEDIKMSLLAHLRGNLDRTSASISHL
jgi:hypothetical protein